MNEERIRKLFDTDAAAEQTLARLRKLEAKGYELKVRVNKKGEVVISMAVVLSEWEGERDE